MVERPAIEIKGWMCVDPVDATLDLRQPSPTGRDFLAPCSGIFGFVEFPPSYLSLPDEMRPPPAIRLGHLRQFLGLPKMISGSSPRVYEVGEVGGKSVKVATSIKSVNELMTAEAGREEVLEALCADSRVGAVVELERGRDRTAERAGLGGVGITPIALSGPPPAGRAEIGAVVGKTESMESPFAGPPTAGGASPVRDALVLEEVG